MSVGLLNGQNIGFHHTDFTIDDKYCWKLWMTPDSLNKRLQAFAFPMCTLMEMSSTFNLCFIFWIRIDKFTVHFLILSLSPHTLDWNITAYTLIQGQKCILVKIIRPVCRVHPVRSISASSLSAAIFTFHFMSACYFSAHSEEHMYRRALKHERRFLNVMPREAFRLADVPNIVLAWGYIGTSLLLGEGH